MRTKFLAVLLAAAMMIPSVAVNAVVACSHEDVSSNGMCQNESCRAQALAKFVCGDAVEYFFTANNLAWKTINMNNNDTDDIYTVTILNDIPSVSLTILADTVTLDLNGFSIGYTGGDFGNIVYLEEKGNLTITDSSENGTGSMINPTGPVVDFARAGAAPESNTVLTVEGGTFSGSGVTFWLGGGTLYIKGGTVIGNYQAADGSITGGRFSFDPSADLTEEYEAVQKDDYFVVQKKSSAVTVPIKNSGDGKFVEVSAVVSGDTATVTDVDLSSLETVIGDGADAGIVTIDFSALDTELTEVEIPADTVNKIAEAVNAAQNSAEALEIVFNDGISIEFDGDALTGVAEQAQATDITVSIKNIDYVSAEPAQTAAIGDRPAYDITVKSGSQNISAIGGKISISAPYTLLDNEDENGILVYYVDETGNREACETVYDSELGRVTWITDHLSVYMIDHDKSLLSGNVSGYWAAIICMMNQKFNITATANEGGTITPAGVSEVKYNKSVTYTVIPQDGYCVADVLVDGISVGAVSEYVFENVTEAHTIHAVFEESSQENPFPDVINPDGTVTRSMLVATLWGMEDSPVVNYIMPYSDVDGEADYAEAVRWAAASGIILGYGDDTFGPEDTLTREQMAAILYRYEQYRGGGFKGMWMFLLDYEDRAEVSEWAYEAICWMTMNDIYIPRDGQLAPAAEVTRAEMSQVVLMYIEYSNQE